MLVLYSYFHDSSLYYYNSIFTNVCTNAIQSFILLSSYPPNWEYDIDTRTCLARTMCNQYQTKLEEEEKSTAARISRGILDNLAG